MEFRFKGVSGTYYADWHWAAAVSLPHERIDTVTLAGPIYGVAWFTDENGTDKYEFIIATGELACKNSRVVDNIYLPDVTFEDEEMQKVITLGPDMWTDPVINSPINVEQNFGISCATWSYHIVVADVSTSDMASINLMRVYGQVNSFLL